MNDNKMSLITKAPKQRPRAPLIRPLVKTQDFFQWLA